MAMVASTLSAAIKEKVGDKNPALKNLWGDSVNMDWLFDAIAEAVIEHMTTAPTNLVVTGTTTQSCTAGGAAGVFTSTSIS